MSSTGKKKTSAQLDRDITGALIKNFWDIFEEELVKDVAAYKPSPQWPWYQNYVDNPSFFYGRSQPQYHLTIEQDEPPEVFARRVRLAAQRLASEHGLRAVGAHHRIQGKLARRLGLGRYSIRKFEDEYQRRGGYLGEKHIRSSLLTD